ncbi:MAG: dihydrolipoyl dehydrogenase [Planctomycetota bacterium]|nr:MAG: dihydrolipoyl dehydrogenase [Planctomycetota bacterium]
MVVGELTQEVDLLVIGGGPGGYVAALVAADHGIQTALVEKAEVPGGVCLREGCIPSKALLHVAKIIDEAAHAADFGVSFGKPTTDVNKLRDWKNGVIRKLSGGVKQLLAGRKVDYITGEAEFEDSRTVRIEGADVARIKFKHCIIASGSRAKMLPEALLPRELIWDAADALKIQEIPRKLLVIGGGYIGLELGQVYATLGSEVTVLEALPNILAGADPDLARPLIAKLKKQMKAIITGATLKGAKKSGSGVAISYSVDGKDETVEFDRVLVSVGRRPNSDTIGLNNTQVKVNDRGFIEVDAQRRTTDKRIYAIGDVAGEPMLAHKAMREAKVAVEAIAGKPSVFDPACIPAVVYTDPEVAWCGVTESEATAKGLDVKVTKFPWAGSGRAVSMSRTDGLTKMIFDKKTQRLLGVGIVGAHAGDLIAEGVLAMEMAAVAEDIGVAIHPHPATSETLAEAAEAMFGHAVHAGH